MRVPWPPPAHCLSASRPSPSCCTAEDDVATTREARGAAHPCVAAASSPAASAGTRLAGLAGVSRITAAKQRGFAPPRSSSRFEPRVGGLVGGLFVSRVEIRSPFDGLGLAAGSRYWLVQSVYLSGLHMSISGRPTEHRPQRVPWPCDHLDARNL